jgi:hypothetical protein
MAKIFIATPTFDGKVHAQYALSLSETRILLDKENIGVQYQINKGGSLLVLERNKLIIDFLNSDCSHLLFIDSDIGWPSLAVLKMLEKNVDFIGGVYTLRDKKTFLCRPKENPDRSLIIKDNHLIELDYIASGFILLKREAIEGAIKFHPHLYYKSKLIPGPPGYCLFNTEVWEGEFWGEDYVFCRHMREAGYKIYADPFIELDHQDMRGRLADMLTNDRKKIIPKVGVSNAY